MYKLPRRSEHCAPILKVAVGVFVSALFSVSTPVALGQARPRLPDAVTRALTICSSSAPAECLRALQRLRAPQQNLATVKRARWEARFAAVSPLLEPDSARILPSAQQRDLARLSDELGLWTDAHRDDGAMWLLRGRLAMVLNQLDSAAVALAQATQSLSNDSQTFNDLAMVLVALRRLPEAERALVIATRLVPTEAVPWSNLGAVRLARGQAALAVEAFREAVRVAPTVAQHQSDLGAALLAASQPDAAVMSFGEAVRLSPGEPLLRANLGYALTTVRRFDDAYAELQRATQLGPQCGAAWNNLATVLVHRGDRSAARAALERALQIDPSDARARANLTALDGPAVAVSDAGVRTDSGRR